MSRHKNKPTDGSLGLDEIKASIDQLRILMESQPSFIDQEIVRQGQGVISLFFDPNYGPSLNEYSKSRVALLEKTTVDLASGAVLLSVCRIGLIYQSGKFHHFAVPYAKQNPPGALVATVSLKEIRAFEHHRDTASVEIPQEHLNAAVYYLVSQMAFTMGKPRKASA